MNIVLLESLGVPDDSLEACVKPLTEAGHHFAAYPRDEDPVLQIKRARDADILIDSARIAKMKRGAILINVARGPVVDADALSYALNEGFLGGAGIDVFETEPPLDGDHPLLHSRNTLVTPHVAFASAQSMEARAHIVFDNLTSWIDDRQENVIL